jgi:hypothetical protein
MAGAGWFGPVSFGPVSFGAAWFCSPPRGDGALRPSWLGGLGAPPACGGGFTGADWGPCAGAFGPFGAGWFGGPTVSCGAAGSFLVTGGAASEFGAAGPAS